MFVLCRAQIKWLQHIRNGSVRQALARSGELEAGMEAPPTAEPCPDLPLYCNFAHALTKTVCLLQEALKCSTMVETKEESTHVPNSTRGLSCDARRGQRQRSVGPPRLVGAKRHDKGFLHTTRPTPVSWPSPQTSIMARSQTPLPRPKRWSRRSTNHRAQADLAEATLFLNARAGQVDPDLAVIGFSLGANFALDLAVTDPERIRSVVLFYGTGGGDFSRSRAAYLGHFAEKDAFEPQANVDDLEEALKRAGRPVTFYRYSGTGHWFFEPDRTEAYDPAAASLAWDRTLAFLRHSSTS